jgi:uncharacterized protein (DUF885 family)
MIDRRLLLGAAAAVTAAAAAPSFAKAPPRAAPRPSDPAEAARLKALMDAFMAEDLRLDPEGATSLGLDVGELAWARSELNDASLAGRGRAKALTASQLERLRQVRRSALGGMDAVNYDTVEDALAVAAESDRRFDYGGQGGGEPYVLSQITGAYQSIPNFMDNEHPITGRADADAYLARMEGFARKLDAQTEAARHDAALGVVPPDFVIDKTVDQLKTLVGQTATDALLVMSLRRRLKEKAIEGGHGEAAARIYEEGVRPALQRQVELLASWRPKATHDAGVWRLPDGAAYYALSLRSYTTSAATPAEVHQLGLDLVASLSAEADTLMKTQGLTQGTVGERLQVMFKDPKFLFANTDEAKAEVIASLNAKVEAIESKLPQWFGRTPKTKLLIKRIPKETELGDSDHYTTGSLDGSRPAIYWINLRDSAEAPTWLLPTITFHEGVPGHHLQESIAREAGELPLLRKTLTNSGYAEGWALYAEQLAVEMGMYASDPLGHIGQLHDALLRAVRLVIDSGLHDQRWSREQSVQYFAEHLGDPESAAVQEVERYCVIPGQACSYMQGKLEFLKLRDRAKKALGKRFDIRAFHDAVLLAGNMPLTVLDRRVDDYIAGAA